VSVATDAPPATGEHTLALRGWLAEHEAELAPYRTRRTESIAAGVEHDRGLMALLYEAGWGRWGWPVGAGGLGGPVSLRAVLYDELARAGVEIPEAYVMLETLASLLVSFAPGIAEEHLPAFLRGREIWGQGFSEPEAGSDLAHLRTRAVATSAGFRLTGQKIWTTLGQFSRYAAVLARTGEKDSAHRGLTMLWVDLQQAGVEVRPIVASNGREEFAEMFFDNTPVPASAVIGDIGGGWAAAMYLLQFERGMYAWLRQAVLHRRLREAVQSPAKLPPSALVVAEQALGRAIRANATLRARSRRTVERLSSGENPGPEISIDKALLGRAEQATFDALRLMDWPGMALGPDDRAVVQREEWFYSRAATIFGGAVDVQLDIIAERVLGLPRSR
jgi:alkylation response protein AidB-like acyl-CoA dehydrogenase